MDSGRVGHWRRSLEFRKLDLASGVDRGGIISCSDHGIDAVYHRSKSNDSHPRWDSDDNDDTGPLLEPLPISAPRTRGSLSRPEIVVVRAVALTANYARNHCPPPSGPWTNLII